MTTDNPDQKPKIKWYLRPVMVFVAILAIGPLAIPIVWMSPAFKKWMKVLITAGLVLLTVWTINASVALYHMLKTDMQNLENALNQ